MPYCPVENGELYYESVGSGRAIVLIHAGVTDHRMWDDQFNAFAAEGYQVIRYDTRGFGKTRTQPPATYSNRQDIRDLLDHLKVQNAAVIGVSRGGQIATDFTLEFPDRVWALIPVCAGLGGLDVYDNDTEMAFFDEVEKAYSARDWDTVIEKEIEAWLYGFYAPRERIAPQVAERMRVMLRETYATHDGEELHPRVLEPAAAGRLGEIRVPTLVILADADVASTAITGKALVEGIHGVQQHTFAGVAHLPPMEIPAAFNQVVIEFLRNV